MKHRNSCSSFWVFFLIFVIVYQQDYGKTGDRTKLLPSSNTSLLLSTSRRRVWRNVYHRKEIRLENRVQTLARLFTFQFVLMPLEKALICFSHQLWVTSRAGSTLRITSCIILLVAERMREWTLSASMINQKERHETFDYLAGHHDPKYNFKKRMES